MNLQTGKPEHDVIHTFCCEFVARHSQVWPVEEDQLADEFVSYFRIPPFFQLTQLKSVSETLEIHFEKEALPEDLLGANIRFKRQRRIAVSNRAQLIGMQGHTFLHEVRELLEYEFHDIGYPTADLNSDDLEIRAEEFAVFGLFSASEKAWPELLDAASHIESPWKQFAAIVLISFGAFMFLLSLQHSAKHAQLEGFKGPRGRG